MLAKSSPRYKTSRRRFLRTVGLFVGVMGASLATFLPVVAKLIPPRLRPPGAIKEEDFLASCIKCGQCVQVCPVEAIFLAELDDGMGIGVPYIDARSQACDFSCDAVQCVLACPTGSLSHEITKKEEVRMGLAKIIKPEACLAKLGLGFKGYARGTDFTGKIRYADIDRWNPIPVREHPYDLELCDLCVRECPIEGAISLQDIDGKKGKLPVIHETCVGCGVCEMLCPVEPTVIVIEERKVWEQQTV
ncbi:MAG: 4Fe-4S dicluster domain-containing protein [Candidatus Marithrix sp.]|nr:4Fe-4S dicluster domain-containing protein [Candidatus Marithrix sp.]